MTNHAPQNGIKTRLAFFFFRLRQRLLYIIGLISKYELKQRISDRRLECGIIAKEPIVENHCTESRSYEMRSYYYSQLRPEMMEFVKGTPKRILEIGCGAGCFRRNFDDGAEYWGVEPQEEAAELANKVLYKTLVGTYDSVCANIPDGYFDLVVCNDVIEHMPDPRAFLVSIRTKLVPEGTMIVSVPNLRNIQNMFELLFKGDFRYRECGVLDYTHFHLFTKKSLLDMAVEHGWCVEVCRPIHKLSYERIAKIMLALIGLVSPEMVHIQIAASMTPNNH